MRITKFWAKGYRSLKDVTLDPIGPFAVFYGPNGSGKSNVLAAIDALHRCVGLIARDQHASLLNVQRAGKPDAREPERTAADTARTEKIVATEDRSLPELSPEIVLGAVWEPHPGETKRFGVDFNALAVEIAVDVFVTGSPRLYVSRLAVDGVEPPKLFDVLPRGIDTAVEMLRAVSEGFSMIDVVRNGRAEAVLGTGLKRSLLDASVSPDRRTRDRFAELQRFLHDPPLRRPRFDVVVDPDTKEIDVRERFGEGEISIDRIGLGHYQVYAILATILLHRRDMVAVEEPEAHLHAPTTGRQLREILARVVQQKVIDQLFVATHSNLFDLDPGGYWDVSIDEATKTTSVARKPLREIDRLHLYEPGPAKRALEEVLRLYGDEFTFRRDTGERLTAQQMLDALQKDEDVAVEFLKEMHAAALQVVGLGTRRPAPKAPA